MNKLLLFLLALLCLAGLFAPLMAPHDAQFYFDRGSEILSTANSTRKWTYRWDLYNAEGDFSHALKLNPNFTAAYTNRANVEFVQGNFDGALKDYSSAIRLNPQDPNNYLLRARVEAARHDFEPALADFGKVIAMQPENWLAYHGRIHVRERQGDFSGAVRERVRLIEVGVHPFNNPTLGNTPFFAHNPNHWAVRFLRPLDHALETDPSFAWGYYYRGVIESLTNDWSGALADFQRCQTFPDGRLKDYAAIHIWLAQTQAGEPKKADQGLLAYCQNRTNGTPADWQMHIAKYLLNQISETDLSNAIDRSDSGMEQSEFWYYTGMKYLLAGDKAEASERFQKSLATKTRPYAVFVSAGAELSAHKPATSGE